jgi:hypothetical protein
MKACLAAGGRLRRLHAVAARRREPRRRSGAARRQPASNCCFHPGAVGSQRQGVAGAARRRRRLAPAFRHPLRRRRAAARAERQRPLPDLLAGRPAADRLGARARARARHVLAIGTCSAFGGIISAGENLTDACGLQFDGDQEGGLLGGDFRSRWPACR